MKTPKTTRRKGRRHHRMPPNRMNCCRVGILTITRQENGKLWLTVNSGPNRGEGMQTDEAKLAAHLEEFYRKEF